MIHVMAVIQTAEGRREDFLAEFHKIAPLVRAEEGCLEYGPTVDAATDVSIQTPTGPHAVTAVEKWESNEALKAHLDAPHMLEFRERIEELVEGMTLHTPQPA